MRDAGNDQSPAHEALERAVALSRELSAAAAGGDSVAVTALDRERRKLLELVAGSGHSLDAAGSALLREVIALNHQSIGTMEHQRRIVQRQLDGVVVGRRAVNAYGVNGRYR